MPGAAALRFRIRVWQTEQRTCSAIVPFFELV